MVRGLDPMAPRDPIPLRLPEPPTRTADDADDPGTDDDRPSRKDLKPFERGPEITEIH